MNPALKQLAVCIQKISEILFFLQTPVICCSSCLFRSTIGWFNTHNLSVWVRCEMYRKYSCSSIASAVIPSKSMLGVSYQNVAVFPEFDRFDKIYRVKTDSTLYSIHILISLYGKFMRSFLGVKWY